MEYVAIGIAVVAVVIALAAKAGASSLRREVEEARDDARRRVQNATDELRRETQVTREHLAALARGERVDGDMILEGRAWRDVGPREAAELVARGAVRVLDVRTPNETASGVIPGAVLVPLDELEARAGEIGTTGAPWLVVCAAGARSAAACEFLAGRGHRGLVNLDGGMSAWTGPRARTS